MIFKRKGISPFYSSSRLFVVIIEYLSKSVTITKTETIRYVLPSGRALHLQDGVGKTKSNLKLIKTLSLAANTPNTHYTEDRENCSNTYNNKKEQKIQEKERKTKMEKDKKK